MQIEQHLLAILGRDDDDLLRRLTDGGDGALSLTHLHAALRIAQFDQSFENDQRCLAAGIDAQRPVGAANGGGRRRRDDVHTRSAAFGAGPDGARLQFQRRIGFAGAAIHALDKKRGVARKPHLGAVGKQHRELPGGIGAQHVARHQVLLQVHDAPVGDVDEPDFFPELARDHRARSRGVARNRLGPRRNTECQRRARQHRDAKSKSHCMSP